MGRPTGYQAKQSADLAEAVRQKIKTTLLVNFLEEHVLEGKKAEGSQITAALGLLKKVCPDLASVDMKTEAVPHVISDQPIPTEEQWEQNYSIQ